jgi:putative endopeptidase
MNLFNLKRQFTVVLFFTLVLNAFGQKSGFDPGNLDRSVEACTDFNRFANGGWLAKNAVPPAFSSWGSFDIIIERNRDILHEILEDAAKKKAPQGSNEQKLGDLYASCMNEEQIEKEGLNAIEPLFKAASEIKNKKNLLESTAHLQNSGIGVMFGFISTPDDKNNTQVIGGLVQGGLGLPDPDYYLKQDEKSRETRAEYLKHIARMLELLGDEPEKAKKNAEIVMAIETKLAEASYDNVKLRDPNANYHKMSVGDLYKMTPDIPWEAYFKARGVQNLKDVDVAQPEFFTALEKNLSAVSLTNWKTYLRWQIINDSASNLSKKFDDANFDFNGRYLFGTKERLPRWKRCIGITNGSLGEALGQEYVKRAFPPKAKARMNEMIDNLMLILRRDLAEIDWMSDSTKKEALKKLSALKRKIGYPEKWLDYSSLDISRDSFFNNLIHVSEFNSRRNLNKIGKPVDRAEWKLTPSTVNAYYQVNNVEIVFPAGILQPPIFNFEADDAINYGGMGAVIGHEIIHGFDDSGREYDSTGVLRDWWTAVDSKNYENRTACVEKQFSSFKVFDDLNVNGKLVLGESVADLGGLRIAYEAFKKSMEGKPRPQNIDGFTPEQRFFLGWAQVWAENSRPEFDRFVTQTDEHPLARFRANGPLSNMPQFAEAFSCKVGDAMVRAQKDRCHVW